MIFGKLELAVYKISKLFLKWSSFLSVTKVSQNATFFLPWQGICDIIPHGVKIHTQENSSVEVKIPFLRR